MTAWKSESPDLTTGAFVLEVLWLEQAAIDPSDVSAVADVPQTRRVSGETWYLEKDFQLARDMTVRHWITSFQFVAHDQRLAAESILSAPLKRFFDVRCNIKNLDLSEESHQMHLSRQKAATASGRVIVCRLFDPHGLFDRQAPRRAREPPAADRPEPVTHGISLICPHRCLGGTMPHA